VAWTFNTTSKLCSFFVFVTGTTGGHPDVTSGITFGKGNCTVFSEVNETYTSPTTVSSTAPPQLFPSWPASSPWVTAVGATRFQHPNPAAAATTMQKEAAVESFGSGGGFSTLYSQEDAQWQTAAVDAYLNTTSRAAPFPPSSLFSPTGRATPDVAALGQGFQVVYNGQVKVMGGTSASAPTFAALVSLLNEARLQGGMPPMGFLNPWLYANPGAFTDITVGTNAINGKGQRVPFGFNCTAGWDPVTGLGTPKFGALLEAALAAGRVKQSCVSAFQFKRSQIVSATPFYGAMGFAVIFGVFGVVSKVTCLLSTLWLTRFVKIRLTQTVHTLPPKHTLPGFEGLGTEERWGHC
jgi:hypothetical protein